MESTEDNNAEEKSNVPMSAAQRRAEIRRRKLLKNSEDRLHRIVGYSKNDGENSRKLKPLWTYALFSSVARGPTYLFLLAVRARYPSH